MVNTYSDSMASGGLRRQAEAAAQGEATGLPGGPAEPSIETMRELLHDLRVHQIELEMQNEELRRTQEKLEASREEYFKLYDLAPMGYFTLNGEGVIQKANLTAAGMLGRAPGILVAQPFTRLIVSGDQDIYYLARKQLLETGLPQTCELRMVRAPAEPFWVRLESSLGHDVDGAIVCRTAMSDISVGKRVEEDLIEARRAAESASRSKSEFLANMSHDLRTPMNGILGFTRLALAREISPKVREYLNHVVGAGDSLLAIINDILDISKIEAGRLELDPGNFDVRDALAKTVRNLAAQADLKGLSVTVEIAADVPAMVLGDAAKVEQVLCKLVGNAIKFTRHGGVDIRVLRAPSALVGDGQGVWLLFEVEDTGIGIAESQQKVIFEVFRQADSSITRQFGGTGLGLAISYHLAAMMGGTIWVESEEGKGSIFHVTLRLDEPTEAAEAVPGGDVRLRAAEEGIAPRSLRILLAEDDPTSQVLATTCLEDAGHSVTLVSNGKDVLAALAEEPFDVVLMDVAMPVMDGLEASRRIRRGEAPGMRDVCIVALTAHAIAGDKERFLEAGMDAYISKPFTIEGLLSLMKGVRRP